MPKLAGEQKSLGHFLQKALNDLDLSLALGAINTADQDSESKSATIGTTFVESISSFVGFPTVNSSLWNNMQLCSDSWDTTEDATVLCRSLGHNGGGQR